MVTLVLDRRGQTGQRRRQQRCRSLRPASLSIEEGLLGSGEEKRFATVLAKSWRKLPPLSLLFSVDIQREIVISLESRTKILIRLTESMS